LQRIAFDTAKNFFSAHHRTPTGTTIMKTTSQIFSAAAFALVGTCALAGGGTAKFDTFGYEGHDAVYDTVKGGAGSYFNPILPGFYPDPSIVAVGADYYLVNSTFSFFPGLPVFHSTDLVQWTQIGNAIDRPSQVDFSKLEISRGLYAPAISFHKGTYYIVNTCVACGGNFVITAKTPAGPWSDPVWLPFEGIDPSLFFDADGKAYMVNNGMPQEPPRYDGHRAIWLQEFDPAAGKMVGGRKVIVDGGTDIAKKPIWIEGPHLFKKDGWYYLICAEGGTGDQHSEVVFRSKTIWGPYRSYEGNPILTQRDLPTDRPFPVTSTGHAQLVATADGKWWSVFLGTRPYGDDLYNTGRETFLLPVTWKDGWPVILKKGAPVPYSQSGLASGMVGWDTLPNGNFAYADLFDGPALSPQWLFVRTPKEKWYAISDHTLSVAARPVAIGSDGQPAFVGRRQQHGAAEVSIGLQFTPDRDGARAGLVAFQNSTAFYFLGLARESGQTNVCVSRRFGASEPENGATLKCAPAPEGKIWLKMAVRGGRIDFSTSTDRKSWSVLLRDADATILSTKRAGGFVGTVIGPYAYSP
jgi:xylan 1,4-beta-xylosidase